MMETAVREEASNEGGPTHLETADSAQRFIAGALLDFAVEQYTSGFWSSNKHTSKGAYAAGIEQASAHAAEAEDATENTDAEEEEETTESRNAVAWFDWKKQSSAIIFISLTWLSLLVIIGLRTGDDPWRYLRASLLITSPFYLWLTGVLARVPYDHARLLESLGTRLRLEATTFAASTHPGSGQLALRRAENLLASASIERRLAIQSYARNILFVVLATIPVVGATFLIQAVHGHKTHYYLAIIGISSVFELLALAGAQVVRSRLRSLEAERGQLLYERNLLIEDAVPVERSEKFYLKVEFEAQRYYDEQLRQSAMLSHFGIFCIVAGLISVGAVLYFVTTVEDDITTSIVLGSLGIVSGILTNFVAFSFVRMHSATVTALQDFHKRMAKAQLRHLAALELERARTVKSDATLEAASPAAA